MEKQLRACHRLRWWSIPGRPQMEAGWQTEDEFSVSELSELGFIRVQQELGKSEWKFQESWWGFFASDPNWLHDLGGNMVNVEMKGLAERTMTSVPTYAFTIKTSIFSPLSSASQPSVVSKRKLYVVPLLTGQYPDSPYFNRTQRLRILQPCGVWSFLPAGTDPFALRVQ